MDNQLFKKNLRKITGDSSFARGQDYFYGGNVLSVKISVEDEEECEYDLWIEGKVNGSSAKIYDVELGVFANADIMTSKCSCPVGGSCKHVVALGLASIPFLDHTPATIKTPEKSAKVQDWEKRLLPIVQNLKPTGKLVEAVYLYLRLERYTRQVNKQKTAAWRLQIRTYLEGAAQQSTWNEFSSQYGGYRSYGYQSSEVSQISDADRRYLRSLATALGQSYYGQIVWASIEDVHAQDVYELLLKAAENGIDVRQGPAGEYPVSLSEQPLRVAVTIEDTVTGISIAPRLSINGLDIGSTPLLFIGDPPVFGVSFEETSAKHSLFSIHKVEGKLGGWALHEPPLEIPTNGIQDFQKRYLPQMLSSATLDNNSSVLSIPTEVEPRILLEIGPHDVGSIEFRTAFLYGAVEVHSGSDVAQDGSTSYVRSHIAERTLRARIVHDAASYSAGLTVPSEVVATGSLAVRIMTKLVPFLETLPYMEVRRLPDLPEYTAFEGEPSLELEVDQQEGETDWFDLRMRVSVDGQDVPFAELFAAIHADEEFLILESGKYIELSQPIFDKLRALIRESAGLIDQKDGTGKISKYQAGYWEELLKLGVITKQVAAWQNAMKGLLESGGVPEVAVPKTLQATLRGYQAEGYSWLCFLYAHGLGGILADDMGLGKTVQVIAFICSVFESIPETKPFLVIAPTSVVENWDLELTRFAPHLKTVIFRRGDRSELHRELGTAQVVVISYALMVRDIELLKNQRYSGIIMDEAQYVKNHQTKAYALIRQLSSPFRLAMTGTPMENNLGELWSILSLSAPGLFPVLAQFVQKYRNPIEKHNDNEALSKLRTNIRPFMLRRRKEMVATDLPPKTEQTIFLELDPAHRKLYDLQLQKERKVILGLLTKGLNKNRVAILASLTNLRQLCLHPSLIKGGGSEELSSVKLESLVDQVSSIVSEGHKVLVFSQFVRFLKMAQSALDTAGIRSSYLDGSTDDRQKVVKEFQVEKETSVFLISLRAGGNGLNLTEADYGILLDPWWNPAVENQAMDRMHRIGQTRPVMVYRFITTGTIEEKVLVLQERKRILFKNILDDGEIFASQVSEDDIRALLEG